MHTLLLGNGLNRLSAAVDWAELLRLLVDEFDVGHLVQHMDQKPLSMLFEELCAHCGGKSFRGAERSVKTKIASLVGSVMVNELHRQYAAPFDVILTTNYDDTLERAISGPMFTRAHMYAESRYSLFRRCRAANKDVWHIHGDSTLPESIVLGFDHYAGYLQKIRNYFTDGIRISSEAHPIRSPIKSGATDFERWGRTYSWADHFLRDHLHIVGLGLDFTEIDIWWLLLHKRRRKIVTGRTFYYDVNVLGSASSPKPQLSVLRSLGVDVQEVPARTYHEGYVAILDLITANTRRYPSLLQPAQPLRDDQPASAELEIGPEGLRAAQLKLPMRRARKRLK